MEELIDLYDCERQDLHRKHLRTEPTPHGCYRIIVSIMTVNANGEILLTRRAPQKRNGNDWEITAGAVKAGESSEAAAMRELFEETGIRTQPGDLTLVGTVCRDSRFFDYYLLRRDVSIREIRLADGETVDAIFVKPNRFLRMMQLSAGSRFLISRYQRIYSDVFDSDAKGDGACVS